MLPTYGETITPPRTGKPGRPKKPSTVAPAGLLYAIVHKTRYKGRVVHVEPRIVFGEEDAVRAALAASPVSTALNTAFVERYHGTDRNRNGHKVRRTAWFSKDWQVHNAVTYFTMYSYNFCWPVRTLRVRQTAGGWPKRTPAMAAGLADHVWSLTEWLTFPVVQMKPPRSKLRGITRKGIVCETPRFLTLFPLQGNLGASSEESPDSRSLYCKAQCAITAVSLSSLLSCSQTCTIQRLPVSTCSWDIPRLPTQ